MEDTPSQEPSAVKEAQPQRTIDQGLEEVRNILGERADVILPADKETTELTKEEFQSNTYRNRGYSEDKGRSDGSFYTATHQDGSQTFILHAKDNSNPFAASLGGLGGIDMRQWQTYSYQYDGNDTITATEPNGRVSKYSGEYGKPEAMLPTVKGALGRSVGVENFVKPSQPTVPTGRV